MGRVDGKVALVTAAARGQGRSHAVQLAEACMSHYTAAKHGVTGLMPTVAVELVPHRIRVNSVHPATVSTPMVHSPAIYRMLFPDIDDPMPDQVRDGLMPMNALPTPWMDAADVSNVVLHLAPDEARYITGSTQMIDAGGTAPFRLPHQP